MKSLPVPIGCTLCIGIHNMYYEIREICIANADSQKVIIETKSCLAIKAV